MPSSEYTFQASSEPQAGYEVLVRVIHKDDRFVPDISTMDFPLTPVAHSLNNLWQANVTIPVRPGTYLYRYQLLLTLPGTLTPKVIARWFTDPFARATDMGTKAPGQCLLSSWRRCHS